MFLANPVIENSLIIINAIRNPPIILNNEANRAVFAELIFISVSLWPRTSKAKGIVINPIISIGLNIISGVFIFTESSGGGDRQSVSAGAGAGRVRQDIAL